MAPCHWQRVGRGRNMSFDFADDRKQCRHRARRIRIERCMAAVARR
jgi:hypothetical protein